MGYRIGWLIPDRIYIIQAIGDITFEEIQEACGIAVQLVSNGKPPVHCIWDTRQLGKFPTDIIQLRHIAAPIMNHPNLGWVMVLTHNRVVNFIASIVSSFSSVRYSTATHPDVLLSGIKRIDTTLPELPIELDIQSEITSTLSV